VGGVKEQYEVTVTNNFVTLENLEDNGDINRVWDTIRENVNILTKKILIYCNQSIINHGLMRNVENWLLKGCRLNYSGCKTQVK
jgi:hypothetical protein